VGASGLLLLDESVDVYHPTAVRASMGTLFWYPVAKASFAAFAAWSKEHGYHVYGSSAHGDREHIQLASYQSPAILLLGGEREGLTAEQTELCEAVVRLPMKGQATSMNLAVAAGILLYDMAGKFVK
jgi:TrmH family RNA methyltransferase